MSKNIIRLTESQLRNLITESVKNCLNEDSGNALACALQDIDDVIAKFENVQSMAYNFGMENEVNEVFNALYSLKERFEELQNQ